MDSSLPSIQTSTITSGTTTITQQPEAGTSAAPLQPHGAGPSSGGPSAPEHLILRLVPKKKKKKKKGVQWAEDVVDNEALNKKKSKKCCIFHKQKAFGEWSDEEDSDDECEICHSEGNRS